MKRSTAAFALVGIIAGVAALGAWNRRDEPPPSPAIGANPYDAKAAAEAKPASPALTKAISKDDRHEAAFQNALARSMLLGSLIRKSANDPKSIEFADAFYTDAGAVGLEYRGKNAFGALVMNKAVMAPDGKTASGAGGEVTALWNRHIANK